MVRRAAVVGGTAYAVGKHNANRRQEEEAQAAYEQGVADAQAPAPPPPPQQDTVEQLKRLAELRDQGVLTEEEFTAEKRKILGM
jgi:hypothetical protein